MVKKIDEFGKEGGVGRALQDKLEERQHNTVHWLEEWWDDYSYLAYRDSVRRPPRSHISGILIPFLQVVVYVSYYCPSYTIDPTACMHLPVLC